MCFTGRLGAEKACISQGYLVTHSNYNYRRLEMWFLFILICSSPTFSKLIFSDKLSQQLDLCTKDTSKNMSIPLGELMNRVLPVLVLAGTKTKCLSLLQVLQLVLALALCAGCSCSDCSHEPPVHDTGKAASFRKSPPFSTLQHFTT